MRIVVTGYAGLDYAVRLDSPAQADRTATILSRPLDWPRLGGSPAYVVAALAAAGVNAAPVTWVGDDADGARFRAEIGRLGVDIGGVSTRPGRTPVCILAYQPDGGCLCLYDPGLAQPIELDESQRALVAEAEVLCLTVGPASATREALAVAPRGAKVVWAVKADRRATPPDLAAALAARANVVIHSRAEAPFVAEAFAAAGGEPTAARIETRGRDGVAIACGATSEFVAVAPIEVEDATGAGDTFVGGFLAAYAMRAAPLREAVQAGAAGARAMLAARAAATKG